MKTLRIHFSKTGEAAYISHLDLQRVMARALRKSGLPVWWSQGFNPHIYLRFALPLPLGQESLCEAVDVKTEDDGLDAAPYLPPLNAALPKGIQASRIAPPLHGAEDIAYARYRITHPEEDRLRAAAEAYNRAESAPVLRKTKRSEEELDLKQVLPNIEVRDDAARVLLPAGSAAHYSPALLLDALQRTSGIDAAGFDVLREEVLLRGGERFG